MEKVDDKIKQYLTQYLSSQRLYVRAAGIWIFHWSHFVPRIVSLGPASRRRTFELESSVNLLAKTQPADPAPTIIYWESNFIQIFMICTCAANLEFIHCIPCWIERLHSLLLQVWHSLNEKLFSCNWITLSSSFFSRYLKNKLWDWQEKIPETTNMFLPMCQSWQTSYSAAEVIVKFTD